MMELVGGLVAEAIGTMFAGLFAKVIRPFLRPILWLTFILVVTLPVAYWYFS